MKPVKGINYMSSSISSYSKSNTGDRKAVLRRQTFPKGGGRVGVTDVAPITPDQDPTDFCILLSDMVQRKVTQISNWWG